MKAISIANNLIHVIEPRRIHMHHNRSQYGILKHMLNEEAQLSFTTVLMWRKYSYL